MITPVYLTDYFIIYWCFFLSIVFLRFLFLGASCPCGHHVFLFPTPAQRVSPLRTNKVPEVEVEAEVKDVLETSRHEAFYNYSHRVIDLK